MSKALGNEVHGQDIIMAWGTQTRDVRPKETREGQRWAPHVGKDARSPRSHARTKYRQLPPAIRIIKHACHLRERLFSYTARSHIPESPTPPCRFSSPSQGWYRRLGQQIAGTSWKLLCACFSLPPSLPPSFPPSFPPSLKTDATMPRT